MNQMFSHLMVVGLTVLFGLIWKLVDKGNIRKRMYDFIHQRFPSLTPDEINRLIDAILNNNH